MFRTRTHFGLFHLVCLFFLLISVGCEKKRDVVQEAKDEKRLMPGVVYVRGGVVVDHPDARIKPMRKNAPLPGEPVLLGSTATSPRFFPVAWVPGQRFEVDIGGKKPFMSIAPFDAWPFKVATFPLGDVGDAAASSEIPDAEVAFSPDGKLLAMGSFEGKVKVVRVPTGEVVLEKDLAEGLIRRLAFSPDSSTLYVGEQSPDGYLYAIGLSGGVQLWRIRMADDVESSRPPPAEGRFGVYSLPGVYGLKVLSDGRIVASGLHSWTTAAGKKKQKSRLFVIDPSGQVSWKFPEKGPLDMNLLHFDVDAAGSHLVFATTRHSPAPNSARIREGGVYNLDLATRTLLWGVHFDPLKPWFNDVFMWESLSITPDGGAVVVGLGDGRAFLLGGQDGKVLQELRPGTPIDLGGIPVTTPVSFTAATVRGLYLQTNDTNLPSGTTDKTSTPSAPHPGAGTLMALGRDGTPRWQYRGEGVGSGIIPSADGRYLMMPIANRRADNRRDLHGFLLFDLDRPEPRAFEPLFHYNTEGPSFFRAALSPDGLWAAVVETPAPLPDGTLYGTYQVHLVR